MSSIFTKIIAGEIPCYKVGETENCFAFLDIRPQQKGHTLVVPKKEVDKLFDLDAESYAELFDFARKVALSIEKEFDCNRCGMAVIGLEVPHAHIHLIPINSLSDLTFGPGLTLEAEEFKAIAERIGGNL
jgi:histidine triad (HIT) family protein